jgi:hypothetical protein
MSFTKVILETPYAGNIQLNLRYARICTRDCLLKGEAVFASHLIYTQKGVLSDTDPTERALGIEAGLAWGSVAAKVIVYTDLGITKGMELGIKRATQEGRIIEYRNIPNWNSEAIEDVVNPAALAYAAYGKTTNFKNFQSNPMPEWIDLPESVQKAWWAATQAVMEHVLQSS